MTRAENDQVLDPTDDPPVPFSIHLTLIAGVEPAIAEDLRRLRRTVPVPGKDIRATHDDLFIFAELHLDPADCRACTSGDDIARIIHGTDRGRLRQTVHL